jgi:hypothetical protein
MSDPIIATRLPRGIRRQTRITFVLGDFSPKAIQSPSESLVESVAGPGDGASSPRRAEAAWDATNRMLRSLFATRRAARTHPERVEGLRVEPHRKVVE